MGFWLHLCMQIAPVEVVPVGLRWTLPLNNKRAGLKDSRAHSMQRRETFKPSVIPSESSHSTADLTILENYLFFLCINLEMVIEPELWCSSCIEALRCSLFFILFSYVLHFRLFFDFW